MPGSFQKVTQECPEEGKVLVKPGRAMLSGISLGGALWSGDPTCSTARLPCQGHPTEAFPFQSASCGLLCQGGGTKWNLKHTHYRYWDAESGGHPEPSLAGGSRQTPSPKLRRRSQSLVGKGLLGTHPPPVVIFRGLSRPEGLSLLLSAIVLCCQRHQNSVRLRSQRRSKHGVFELVSWVPGSLKQVGLGTAAGRVLEKKSGGQGGGRGKKPPVPLLQEALCFPCPFSFPAS